MNIINRKTVISTETKNGTSFETTIEDKVSWCNRTRQKLLDNRTYYENKIYSLLPKSRQKDARRQQCLVLNGHILFPDIYFINNKAIVEIDGGYHNTPQQKEIDKERDAICTSFGVRVFRITNEEINNSETLREFIKLLNSLSVEKARLFDPLGHAGLTLWGKIVLTPFGKIKMTPVGYRQGNFFVVL